MKSKINRNLETNKNETFDVIIVGGGIYGAMLALETGLRNKRVLLLEKDDFGGSTSLYHLRTIHGGLRYLQTADLPRFFESVRERRWFLTMFPKLSEVLPCLMPLYGKGIYRNPIFRMALLANDVLSCNRNSTVEDNRRLPNGRVVSAETTREIFPKVDAQGLKGSALWYDGSMPEHQRLYTEILRWACHLGAKALNYTKVEDLLKTDNTTAGVKAIDQETGKEYSFPAPIVINAAGPQSRELAKKIDKDFPSLFVNRLLLWNILFKREALSDHALALTPGKGKGHTYFFHNWKNRMLIGTGEEAIREPNSKISPTEEQIDTFINDLNQAVPGLKLTVNDIEHIYAGILPSTAQHTLSKREVIINHGKEGGPSGLFSVSGVKFTTSRLVAEKTLDIIFPETIKNKQNRFTLTPPQDANSGRGTFAYDWMPPASPNQQDNGTSWLQVIKKIIEEESVVHLDDLIYRRTSLGENSERVSKITPLILPLFNWGKDRCKTELARLK
jgi:glycerol-3-phosphate dehydrogenase